MIKKPDLFFKGFYFSFLILSNFAVAGCSIKPCRDVDTSKLSSQKLPKGKESDQVQIFKPEGSKQCGQGTSMPLLDMEKELVGITVFSKRTDHDGLMRIQVCGAPTGKINIFEIRRSDLPAAEKLGFQKLP